MSAQAERIQARLKASRGRSNGRAMVADFEAEKQARDALVLIPSGLYVCIARNWKLGCYRSRNAKLKIELETVCDIDGDSTFAGKPLFRHFNVSSVDLKNGSFVASGPKSSFVREFQAVTNRRITRSDRVPMSAIQGMEIVCRVKTVVEDSDGYALHELSQYSVVEKLLRPARPDSGGQAS